MNNRYDLQNANSLEVASQLIIPKLSEELIHDLNRYAPINVNEKSKVISILDELKKQKFLNANEWLLLDNYANSLSQNKTKINFTDKIALILKLELVKNPILAKELNKMRKIQKELSIIEEKARKAKAIEMEKDSIAYLQKVINEALKREKKLINKKPNWCDFFMGIPPHKEKYDALILLQQSLQEGSLVNFIKVLNDKESILICINELTSLFTNQNRVVNQFADFKLRVG